jgi:phosphate transport system substrate-binding protein
VIHRTDGSGTTFALTHYLSDAVRAWKESVGEGDKVRWPVGEGAAGNEGVSALVENTPYSFGYTEFIYAFRRELNIVSLLNPAGRFVQPDLASIAAAAASMMDAIPDDFNLSLTNAPGRDAYPISTLTWLVVPAHEANGDKREAVKRFLQWALTSGQRQTMGLGYVPLPKPLVEAELRAVAAMN